MPRSIKDSDEDVEIKIGRKTSMLKAQTVVDSPLRRSSRIKQPSKQDKVSPDSSEKDTSNQPTRITRGRTKTMDYAASETLKERKERKTSISSDISELTDADIFPGTPKKITRRSLAVTSIDTPTKMNTRAASKRFTRASSESKSPLPMMKTTRRTRASSVGLESISDKNNVQSRTPIKTRRGASVLPSGSPVKEEVEEQNAAFNVGSDNILIEHDESVISGNSDLPDNEIHSQDTKLSGKCTSINKYKVEDSNDGISLSISSSPEETLSSEYNKKEQEITSEYMDKVTSDEKSNFIEEQQGASVEIVLSDDISSSIETIQIESSPNKSKIIENEENLAGIEESELDVSKKLSEKELGLRIEHLLNTSVEEQNKNPSNKENQTFNVVNDITEKSTDSIISNAISRSKSLTSSFVSKSLNEKENKPVKRAFSLGKRRHSRESTETAMKRSLPKEGNEDDKEKDIFLISSDTDATYIKQDLTNPSINITNKKQSFICETSNATTVLSQDENIELIDKSVENEIREANKSNEMDEIESDVTDSKISNKIVLNEMNKISCSPMNQSITQEESNTKNPSSMLVTDDNNESYDKQDAFDKELINKLPVQDNIIDNLSNSTEQTNNLSKTIVESIKSFDDTENTNFAADSTSSDNAENQKDSMPALIQNVEKNSSPMALKNTVPKTTKSGKSIDKSELQGNEKLYSKKNPDMRKESMEIVNESDNAIKNSFRDVPTAEWREEMELETNSVHSTLTENESECDLILVDDTILLKNQSDALKASNSVKKLDTMDEELEMDIDNKKDEVSISGKKRKSLIKSKSISGKIKYPEDRNDLSSSDKSPDKLKALNRSNNSSSSKLNKLKQEVKETKQYFTIHSKTEEKIENYSDESPQVNKKNTSPLKSTERRKSLNKSLQNVSLRYNDLNVQNISVNKSLKEDLDEEINNTDMGQKTKIKKRSLSKSENQDKNASENDTIKCENNESLSNNADSKMKKNISLNRSVDKKSQLGNISSLIQLDTEESNDDSEVINIPTKNFKFKGRKNFESDVNYSTIACTGSESDSFGSDNLSDTSGDRIPNFLFTEAIDDDDDDDDDDNNDNDIDVDDDDEDDDDDDDGDDGDDDNSIDSDIKREYNLEGKKRKFSDDNIPGDECRASESEYSDPDDSGSDLADFVVDDDVIEDEEEDENKDKNENEDENQQEDMESEIEENMTDKDITDEENVEKEESAKAGTDANTELSKNNKNKTENIKTKKSQKRENEKVTSLNTSNSSHKKKTVFESQNSMKEIDESEMTFTKKFTGLHRLIDCSTPKLNFHKHKLEINVDTPIEVSKNKNKSNESIQNISLKKKQSKTDSILKEDISLKKFNRTNNKEKTLLHSSLPSDLLDAEERIKLSFSKITGINKTLNVTHTETPTIRHLMKEKLSESAPATQLSEEIKEKKKRRSSVKEKNDTVQIEITKDSDEEVPILVLPPNTNTIQKRNRQKRRREHAEEMLENISDENLSREIITSKISRKKKLADTNQLVTENIDSEDIYQSNEKNKKKKKREKEEKKNIGNEKEKKEKEKKKKIKNEKKEKKQLGITKMDKKLNEDNIQNDIYEEQMERRSKKNKNKTGNNLNHENSSTEMLVNKKTRQQKVTENKEVSSKLSKKRKEEKILQVDHTASRACCDKTSKKFAESEDIFPKVRAKALAAIKSATEDVRSQRMKKELQKRNKLDSECTMEEPGIKIPTKRKQRKEEIKDKIPSCPNELKRLPKDLIENLSDVPMKKRKQEQTVPSLKMNKSEFVETKLTAKKNSNFIPLSSYGSTTQFAAVKLYNFMQPPKTSETVASFRQRMLDRNSRCPTSTYLMYLQKQHIMNNQFSNNPF